MESDRATLNRPDHNSITSTGVALCCMFSGIPTVVSLAGWYHMQSKHSGVEGDGCRLRVKHVWSLSLGVCCLKEQRMAAGKQRIKGNKDCVDSRINLTDVEKQVWHEPWAVSYGRERLVNLTFVSLCAMREGITSDGWKANTREVESLCIPEHNKLT